MQSFEVSVRDDEAEAFERDGRVDRAPRLSVAMIEQLAHDIRGALHTILGHADLLALDARDQDTLDGATCIRDATGQLRDYCDDIVDLLLPVLPDRGSIPLVISDLVESVMPLAIGRGSRVRMLGSRAGDPVEVDATNYRVISHVVERVVRRSRSDVTLSATIRSPGDTCMITVAPIPEGMARDDGVIAIAEHLLAARGGHLRLVGWRLEMRVGVTSGNGSWAPSTNCTSHMKSDQNCTKVLEVSPCAM